MKWHLTTTWLYGGYRGKIRCAIIADALAENLPGTLEFYLDRIGYVRA